MSDMDIIRAIKEKNNLRLQFTNQKTLRSICSIKWTINFKSDHSLSMMELRLEFEAPL